MVAETAVGKRVPVTVWRKRQGAAPLQVRVGRLEDADEAAADAEARPKQERARRPRPVTQRARRCTLGRRSRRRCAIAFRSAAQRSKGVVVVDVTTDSAGAAEKGLKPGDVIVEAAQEAIASPSDVAQGSSTRAQAEIACRARRSLLRVSAPRRASCADRACRPRGPAGAVRRRRRLERQRRTRRAR